LDRNEINAKISLSLIGRKRPHKGVPHSEKSKLKIKESLRILNEARYNKAIQKWKDHNIVEKRSRFVEQYLLKKFENRCAKCGWNEKNTVSLLVPLERHHKDGNHKNDAEYNLELLCPNCHSLTTKYRNHKGRRSSSR
jgi:5-methylcytosine-specific restriction endonuclease McrA